MANNTGCTGTTENKSGNGLVSRVTLSMMREIVAASHGLQRMIGRVRA